MKISSLFAPFPAVYFAGKKDELPTKTKLTPGEIAARAQADERAKSLRPTLPLSIQLFAPIAEHRNGVVAGHMESMMTKLRETGAFTLSPSLEEYLKTAIQEGKAPKELNYVDQVAQKQIPALLGLISHLGKSGEVLIATQLLEKLPEGLLRDICLVSMVESSEPNIHSLALEQLEKASSDSLKRAVLRRIFMNKTEAEANIRNISKIILSTTPDVAETLATEFCTLLGAVYVSEMPPLKTIQTIASQPDGILIPSEIVSNEEIVMALAAPPKKSAQFDAFLQRNLSKVMTNAFSTPQLESIYQGFSSPESLSTFLKSQIDMSPDHPNVIRAIVVGVLALPTNMRGKLLQEIYLMDARDASPIFKKELGQQLLKKDGFGPEKQVFIQLGLFDPDDSIKFEAAKLLYSPIPDAVKMATITSLIPHLKKSRGVASQKAYTLAAGAVTTIKNSSNRELVRVWLTTELKLAVHDLTKLQQDLQEAAKDPNIRAVQQITAEAYRPFIERGLPVSSISKMTENLKNCQFDPGLLNRDILPDFDRLLNYAIKHPNKLVKAGEKLPTATEIRKDFQNKHQEILLGLTLLGRPAMELAIDRKRLNSVITEVGATSNYPDLFPLIAKLSRKCVSQYDAIKMVELAQTFIANKTLDAFKTALAEGDKTPKFNIKPLYIETLNQIALVAGISPETLDVTQIDNWNLKHLNTLSSAFKSGDAKKIQDLKDICAAALQGKFGEYLTNPETSVGKANAATKEAFGQAGLNYDKWMNYDKVVKFSMPSKTQYMPEIVKTFEDILASKSDSIYAAMKNFITQRYPFAISDDKKITLLNGSPVSTNEFTYFKEMVTRVKNYYSSYFTESEYQKLVGMNETYSNRLQDHSEELELAVWTRNPGYDLFIGTDTGACTSLEGSRSSMDALQSSFVQMVQLRHPGNKSCVGKILLFWMTNNQTGKKVLIWNTFEGRGGAGSQYEENVFVREQCLKFVEDYAREVSGDAETPIRTGDRYNPTYTDDLVTEHLDCKVIGSMRDNDVYYLDTLGSNVDIREVYTQQKTYCLNNVSTGVVPAASEKAS